MRLGLFIRATVFLVLSLTVGIGSARWMIERSAATVPINVGSWRSLAEGGGEADDPYGAAYYLLNGQLPPAVGQEKIFETEQDDGGKNLSGDCVTTISGTARDPRWWEIAIVDPQSGPQFEDGMRIGAISAPQMVRNPDGYFTVVIARRPMPGNWISPGNLDRFSLIMRVRLGRSRQTIEPAAVLPHVVQGECS